jgi:hypothetical protein
VDLDKIAFLFGSPPDGADPDDEETRHRLVAARWGNGLAGIALPDLVLEQVADQIASDDPPEVWQTAQRLRAAGIGDSLVMTDLGQVEISMLRRVLTQEESDEEDVQRDLLASLPLPTARHLTALVWATVLEHRSIKKEALVEQVAAEWLKGAESRGAIETTPGMELLLQHVEVAVDKLTEREDGPLMSLGDEHVVELPSLAARAFFVHVLGAAELDDGCVAIAPDLAPLFRLRMPVRVRRVRHGSTAEEVGELDFDVHPELGEVALFSDELLAGLEPGMVLAVRVQPPPAGEGDLGQGPAANSVGEDSVGEDSSLEGSVSDDLAGEDVAGAGLVGEGSAGGGALEPDQADGSEVEVTVLERCPSLDPELVRLVRAAYDAELDGLPVAGERILARLLLEHPGALEAPGAPWGDVLVAAGLRLRRGYGAHDENVWRLGRFVIRLARVEEALDDVEKLHRAADVMGLFEPDAEDPKAADPEAHRQALAQLADVEVLSACAGALLAEAAAGPDDRSGTGEGGYDAVAAFAERLLAAARRPREEAPARFLLALAEERRGDAPAAEVHLELAHQARPDLEPVAERLAWYASDRGDARRAVGLLQRLGGEGHERDLELLRRYSDPAPAAAGGRGRNEPCWCGSGRKFKHCHLAAAPTISLHDRVDWLAYKAAAFLQHESGKAAVALAQLAAARAGVADDADALRRALEDSLVLDVAMHEGGWFERFLFARGELLPDDEALLARSWNLVDRSLYEVVEIRPARSMTVRDLRSAELVEVREHSLSRSTRVGEVLCGRVLPDGESHQFGGATIKVRAGDETALFHVLDRGDPAELLAFVGARERPAMVADEP